jgi:hypothetical protein
MFKPKYYLKKNKKNDLNLKEIKIKGGNKILREIIKLK